MKKLRIILLPIISTVIYVLFCLITSKITLLGIIIAYFLSLTLVLISEYLKEEGKII